jgi:hypothetical protein
MNDEEVIKSVRGRYRVYNYFFRLGIGWFIVGAVIGSVSPQYHADGTASMVELVGAGIFSAAFILTLAIYRCPVCDHYLSRFRPRKDQCPHCGAKVR